MLTAGYAIIITKLVINFLKKLNLATKARRHKGKCVAFFQLSAFEPLWLTFFAAKLRKKLRLLFAKILIFSMNALTWLPLKFWFTNQPSTHAKSPSVFLKILSTQIFHQPFYSALKNLWLLPVYIFFHAVNDK
jgi:hypothetical protein